MPKKLTVENLGLKRLLPTSTNQVLVALLVIAAFLIGVLFTKVQYLEKNQAVSGETIAPSITPAAAAKVDVSAGHFPIKGDSKAKVTLIEFADFRCPFCEQFYTNTEPQILKDYVDTGKVKFAFRNFAFLGDVSTIAANAVECANDQKKFWEYYDYLYQNQPPETDTSMYNTDALTQAAVSLGIDGETFRSCLDSKKNDSKVNQDLADGQKAGVSGTPSFFINGRIIVGACPFETIKGALDAELAKKDWSVGSNCDLKVE